MAECSILKEYISETKQRRAKSNAGLSKDTSKIKLSQIIYELTLHQINA